MARRRAKPAAPGNTLVRVSVARELWESITDDTRAMLRSCVEVERGREPTLMRPLHWHLDGNGMLAAWAVGGSRQLDEVTAVLRALDAERPRGAGDPSLPVWGVGAPGAPRCYRRSRGFVYTDPSGEGVRTEFEQRGAVAVGFADGAWRDTGVALGQWPEGAPWHLAAHLAPHDPERDPPVPPPHAARFVVQVRHAAGAHSEADGATWTHYFTRASLLEARPLFDDLLFRVVTGDAGIPATHKAPFAPCVRVWDAACGIPRVEGGALADTVQHGLRGWRRVYEPRAKGKHAPRIAVRPGVVDDGPL